MSAMPWKRRSLRRSRRVSAPSAVPVAANVFVPTVATPVLAAARTVALAVAPAVVLALTRTSELYDMQRLMNKQT